MAATSEQENTGPQASRYAPLCHGPAHRCCESYLSLQEQTNKQVS